MHTLKQNISIRSQAAFVIALVAFGWLAGSVQAQTGSSSWAGVVDIVWYAIPIFTLILLACYFLSGRAHPSWFYAAVLVVIGSFLIMILDSVV
jgi:hypothetical protein